MKNFIALFAIVMMFAANTFGQAQTTFVKTIACDINNTFAFALAGNVNVTEWDGNTIQITATIEVTNSTEAILQRLYSLGRYNLEVSTEGGKVTINAPKMANHIAVQGLDLLENVTYEINIPRGVTTELLPTSYSNVLVPTM